MARADKEAQEKALMSGMKSLNGTYRREVLLTIHLNTP